MFRTYPTWIGVLVMLCLSAGIIAGQESMTAGYESRTIEIDLGADFITEAELTYPTGGNAPFPTVILFHGSGPYDMDATYTATPGAEPVSANFKLLAETLSANGIAVLRFNKRGVLPGGQIDWLQVQASTLDRLVEDSLAVIDSSFEQPEINADSLYLYGWSEGAWVIANAAQERDIAGLIMQGAPDGALDTILPYQLLELGIPYLKETTDADSNGLLTLEEISQMPAGPIAYSGNFFFYEPGSDVANPSANSFTDRNGDGQFHITQEVEPIMEMYISNYSQFAPQVESSYQTGDLIAGLNVPVLLIHGENDGWVPLSSGQALAKASDNTTLISYEGLGHALSPVENPAEDSFTEMAEDPIQDIITWMQEQ